MDSKELRLFREAYGSVYTPQTEEVVEENVAEEQLDEGAGIVTGTAKAINAVMKPVGQTPEQGEKAVRDLTRAMDTVAKPIKSAVKSVKSSVKSAISLGGRAITAGGGTPDTQRIDDRARRLGGEAMRRSGQYEGADLFDIVKGHLLDEGYADTEEAALAIMANMSEEWRTEIVEGSCMGDMGDGKKKKKKPGY
jgi:hypothetical protein